MNPKLQALALNRKAAIFSISISFFLVCIKAYAWFVTDSLSLLSSLLDSSLDVVVSTLNLWAIGYAAKPADEDHSFGHDAIEDIVGLVQAAFIGASGMFLIYEAVHRFITPQDILQPATGIAVLGISITCTLAIVLYQKYVLKRTGSLVVEADSLHDWSDFLVNGSIIASLFIASRPGLGMADPLIAVAIALYILRSSFGIGARAFHNLMNRELPDETRNALIDILNAQTQIQGFHALKTTRNGSRAFVQLHLELDEKLSLKDAHDIAASVREKLLAVTGDAEITIHEDPVAVNQARP